MKRSVPFAMAVAFAALMMSSAGANETLSLVLDFVPSGGHSPFYYARSNGWYKEAGIDLQIEVGRGSVYSSQSVGSNAADFGISDFAIGLVAIGKGADILAVMNIYGNSPQGLYWLKSSGITGPKDFPGHTIGNPPGDAARAMWPAFAKAVAIDPASVKFVNIAPPAKVASLRSHAVDIISDFYNAHDLKVREFGDDLGFVAWRDVGINSYGLSVITRRQMQRDITRRFVAVSQRAFAACARDAEPCLSALLADVSGLDRVVSQNEWNRVRQLMRTPESENIALGWLSPERVMADYNLVSSYIGLDNPFDPNISFSDEFLCNEIRLPN
jgi:NitT/TauT family transport system substrate-binding protein